MAWLRWNRWRWASRRAWRCCWTLYGMSLLSMRCSPACGCLASAEVYRSECFQWFRGGIRGGIEIEGSSRFLWERQKESQEPKRYYGRNPKSCAKEGFGRV